MQCSRHSEQAGNCDIFFSLNASLLVEFEPLCSARKLGCGCNRVAAKSDRRSSVRLASLCSMMNPQSFRVSLKVFSLFGSGMILLGALTMTLSAQTSTESPTPPSVSIPAGPRPTATVTPLQSSPVPTATVTPLPSAAPAGPQPETTNTVAPSPSPTPSATGTPAQTTNTVAPSPSPRR